MFLLKCREYFFRPNFPSAHRAAPFKCLPQWSRGPERSPEELGLRRPTRVEFTKCFPHLTLPVSPHNLAGAIQIQGRDQKAECQGGQSFGLAVAQIELKSHILNWISLEGQTGREKMPACVS